jgi:arylsulfatase A
MPHLPVSASRRFQGRSAAGLYGDVIETLDWSVGEILGTLKARGLDSRTMVVFASDNGPWHNLPARMLQQGVEPWHTGNRGPFRGAKDTTYEGGVRVPGIFRWPGQIGGGRVESAMAATLDLFPTLVKAAGAALPADRVYDGHDLMPLLRGLGPSPRREFWYLRGKTLEAVRQGSWKYRSVRGVDRELYNVDLDPAEMYNVIERSPGQSAALRERFEAIAKELGAEAA